MNASLLAFGDMMNDVVNYFANFETATDGCRTVALWLAIALLIAFAVTKLERTIVDLVLDDEELSLVRDAYDDALVRGIDFKRLRSVVEGLEPRMARKAQRAFEGCGLHGI